MRCGVGVCAALACALGPAYPAAEPEYEGTFGVYAGNPTYFAYGDRPVVLMGDYTWGTFTDRNFDYLRYLDSLRDRGLNLSRVWLWWGCEEFVGDSFGYPHIEPYLRPGPGVAHDGRPKYDLTQPNPEFEERLRDLCGAARERGIQLQLVAMDAWMLKHAELWQIHAFHRDNNINGVDGDPADTGRGTDGERGFCSLGNPRALEFQKALLARIVDATNEFANVHYEIANENYYSEEWELALCDFVTEYEQGKPRQHLMMRRDLPSHSYLVQTWDLPTIRSALLERRDIRQPLLFDTDWTINESDDEVRQAMWTALVSGGSFSYMDDSLEYRLGEPYEDERPALHRQLDLAAALLRRIRPWEMEPRDSLIAEGDAYAMASAASLVAYVPRGGGVTLDLSGLAANLAALWYNPRTGDWSPATPLGEAHYVAPDGGDWVLLLE